MSRYSLSHVSNQKLLRDLVALVAQERARAAALLALLAEADARGLDVPARTEIEEELAELFSPAEMQAMVQAIPASPPRPDEQLAPAQVEAPAPEFTDPLAPAQVEADTKSRFSIPNQEEAS